MRRVSLVPVIVVHAAVSLSASATIIRVPSHQPTIQAALDNAASSDTILVAPGTYRGDGNHDLDFRGKDLLLSAEGGPQVTVLQCERHRGFRFHSLETRSAVVDGFTITDAHENGGGAIYCQGAASPTFLNCILRRNDAGTGAAIKCDGPSEPLVRNCLIAENTSGSQGALRSVNGACPEFVGCTIAGNSTAFVGAWDGSARFRNCVIANSTDGEAMYCLEAPPPTLVCCDVFGNAGGDWTWCIEDQLGLAGNIHQDPLFCDWLHGDYSLSRGSPCTADQQPDCGQIGALDIGCEPTSSAPSSWGSLKARW